MTDIGGTTTIQDFTDNLVANLKLRPGLADVYVCDGVPPAAYLDAGKWLALLDVEGGQSWAAIDRTRRPKDETYLINCIISVYEATTANADGHQAALNRQAILILAELEHELRTNPTQGVGPPTGTNPSYVLQSEILKPMNLEKRANDNAREAAFRIGIQVRARI